MKPICSTDRLFTKNGLILVEINPKLRTIELTKLLENMQETLKKETEYVIIHKL